VGMIETPMRNRSPFCAHKYPVSLMAFYKKGLEIEHGVVNFHPLIIKKLPSLICDFGIVRKSGHKKCPDRVD
jgi:hypothetical protein